MVESGRAGRRRYPRLKLIALIGLASLLGWLFLNRLERVLFHLRIQTVEAAFGTEETRIEGEGLILREERSVVAPVAGRVTLLVGEGRRVRANDVVIEINDEGDTGAVPVGLERINRELNTLRAAVSAEEGTLRMQRAKIHSRLGDAERVLDDALASAEEEAAREAKSRRDALAAEIASIDARLAELEREEEETRRRLLEERERLLRMRPSDVMLVRSPASGYVSFTLDGLEGEVEPGMELQAARGDLRPKVRRVADGLSVEPGDPLFRLVEVGPVEVIVEAEGRFALDPGERVELTLAEIPEMAFPGTLVEAQETGNRSLLRIRLDAFDPSLIRVRKGRVAVSVRRAQGVIVPAQAVIELGGRRGLYVMVGDRPIFREVRVLGGNAKRLVVDGVSGVPVGAPVVTNPRLIAGRSR